MAEHKRRPTAAERLLDKIAIDPETQCWNWQGGVGGKQYRTPGRGYSVFHFDGRTMPGHRASYLIFKGPIADGLTIDHLCCNTRCVNPDHLEVVTYAENNRRYRATITHCPQGHPYDEANTYVRPGGGRDCRKCRCAVVQRNHAAKRARTAS